MEQQDQPDYGVLYSAKYDAFFNANTGEWIEKRCAKPDCVHCKDRSENALQDMQHKQNNLQ